VAENHDHLTDPGRARGVDGVLEERPTVQLEKLLRPSETG
jgi:hypothetical protein